MNIQYCSFKMGQVEARILGVAAVGSLSFLGYLGAGDCVTGAPSWIYRKVFNGVKQRTLRAWQKN